MTKRVISGVADFTGQKVNSLRVDRMVSIRPAPRYATVCETCGTQSVIDHARIANGSARCVADGCGRAHIGEQIRQTARQYRAEVEADADSKRLEDEERQREADNKAKMALIAERKQKNAEFRRQTTRELIEAGPDPLFVIDPSTMQADPERRGSIEEYNTSQADKFRKANPDYYACADNLTALTTYLERNAPGLRLVSAIQLEAAFKRLRECGLLKERPTVVEPEPQPAPVRTKPNLSVQSTGMDTLTGIDPETGAERTYTSREVYKMGSERYRLCFPTLGTMTELLSALKEQRRQATQ